MAETIELASMARFLRNNKREIIFWLAGLLIFTGLIFYVIFAIRYLVRQFYSTIDPNLIKTVEIVRFRLDKVRELRK